MRRSMPVRSLPAVWFEPHVAECMADWCDRNPDLVTYRSVGGR